MELRQVIASLFLSLGVGSLFTFAVARPLDVGRRYFLYHGIGLLGLVAAAGFLRGPYPDLRLWLALTLIGGAGYLASVTTRPRLASGCLTAALGAGGVSLLLHSLGQRIPGDPLWAVRATDTILGSLALGSSFMAMWLGHWYLTQPKLSIDELKKVVLILLGALSARLVFASVTTVTVLRGRSEAEIYRWLLGSTPGIFFLMRWTWGLIAALILSVMVWKTVKIRSTQSATGILYVVVLAVLTGETLSLFLALSFGILG